MRALSRIAGLLLLITLAARLPGAPALAFSAAPAHPAGCHSHLPAPPVPASYQCCVNAHDAAMPSAIFSPHPALTQFSAVGGDQGALPSFPSDHSEILSVASGSPPGAVPLRI
jgi:hypothetical protein